MQQENEDGSNNNNNDRHCTDGNDNTGPNIQVVLMGAFTQNQHDIVTERMTVNVDRVLAALHWLKKHNILYKISTLIN